MGTVVRAQDFDQAHSRFDTVLKTYVENGQVDYAGLKSNRRELDRYLSSLAAVDEKEFKTWQASDRLALLINLYNAATLQLIIDHYPVKSIKDIGGFFRGPWKQRVVRLFGKTITLNTLEHEIIRKQFDEPRVHAALVCAAQGCPPLRPEAYVGARLEAQLAEQMRTFLADSTKNHVNVRSGKISLSRIFKWYGKDFTKNGKTLLGSLAPYWPDQAAARLKSRSDWDIAYTDYDWSLNERQVRK
ncbi:MAG: DUF547 domain-containing protein [Planctomycetes bacterium]|nr:DUF547 domain-containing protein [Planctomycetota bacterium]